MPIANKKSAMNSRLVYSTDGGKNCPTCRKVLTKCVCPQKLPQSDGIVRLLRQVKGRNGKPVVVISGLPLPGAGLKVVAKQLKSKCGVGGSVVNSEIIIQGDKREILKQELESMGYTVKLSGG